MSTIDFCELTKKFWETYIYEEEPETQAEALEWLAPQCVVIGTGAHEFYVNLKDFLRSLTEEVQERKDIAFHFKDFWCEQMELEPDSCLVYGKLHLWWESEDKSTYINMDSRFTFLYHKIKGAWKIVHIHQSMPNKEQSDGEYYPKTLLEKVQELQELAQQDSMTDLENFRAFRSRWEQRNRPGWLFILDIDYFKRVNDTYGHTAGNEFISILAGILSSSVRSGDFVCRMGGDEFLIYCSGMNTKGDAEEFAHRLQHDIRSAGKKKPYWTTVSIGATYTPLEECMETALERADHSLYAAKQRGRDAFSFIMADPPPEKHLMTWQTFFNGLQYPTDRCNTLKAYYKKSPGNTGAGRFFFTLHRASLLHFSVFFPTSHKYPQAASRNPSPHFPAALPEWNGHF